MDRHAPIGTSTRAMAQLFQNYNSGREQLFEGIITCPKLVMCAIFLQARPSFLTATVGLAICDAMARSLLHPMIYIKSLHPFTFFMAPMIV